MLLPLMAGRAMGGVRTSRRQARQARVTSDRSVPGRRRACLPSPISGQESFFFERLWPIERCSGCARVVSDAGDIMHRHVGVHLSICTAAPPPVSRLVHAWMLGALLAAGSHAAGCRRGRQERAGKYLVDTHGCLADEVSDAICAWQQRACARSGTSGGRGWFGREPCCCRAYLI